jgi:predicted flap endonuclease-1-like 5' DNA nuclease
MSILYGLFAFIIVIGSCAGGAYGMRVYLARNQNVKEEEEEDPRDTEIRNLQGTVTMAKNDMQKSRTIRTEQTEHLDLAHTRIDELHRRISDLSRKLGSAETDLGTTKEDSDLMRDKLSVAGNQVRVLTERNQELEMQVSVAQEPDLLDASMPTENAEADADIAADLNNVFTATEEDDSPSLIQSLTGEVDRWKRHCLVLGEELKTQRVQAKTVPAEPAEQSGGATIIDELTDIRGIGNVLERKLHQLGIYRYQELASLTDEDLQRAQQLIPDFERRMNRDSWIDQARNLHEQKYQ